MAEQKELDSVDLTGAPWWKSSYSENGNQACVETALIPGVSVTPGMAVKDSKDPESPILRFSAEAWTAFVGFAQEIGPDLP